jgi:hypothetical protein
VSKGKKLQVTLKIDTMSKIEKLKFSFYGEITTSALITIAVESLYNSMLKSSNIPKGEAEE